MNFNQLFESESGGKRQLLSAVRSWYRKNGRSLPWRQSSDAYRIWISEVMLQQTTVATVVPAFERFIRQFPDVQALAAADEKAVLRSWEGLGYYSRARNLHKAAAVVMNVHNGKFPEDMRQLQLLPGVGRYTAGAIAAFAFDLPAPIVEANTIRLYSRLMGLSLDARSASGQKQLWAFASWLVEPDGISKSSRVMRPGELNQALMDLGAAVCTPTDPACHSCPLSMLCVACRTSRQQQIPVLRARPKFTSLTETAVAIQHQGQFLLRQYGETERWTGLWDFVRFETAELLPQAKGWQPLPQRWTSYVQEQTGQQLEAGLRVQEIRHTVTRYRIHLQCVLAQASDGHIRDAECRGYQWFSLRQIADLPLSTTARRFADALRSFGNGKGTDPK